MGPHIRHTVPELLPDDISFITGVWKPVPAEQHTLLHFYALTRMGGMQCTVYKASTPQEYLDSIPNKAGIVPGDSFGRYLQQHSELLPSYRLHGAGTVVVRPVRLETEELV